MACIQRRASANIRSASSRRWVAGLLSLFVFLLVGVTVYAQTSSGLTLTPSTVVGEVLSTGKITLSAAAPTGGTVVTLSSSNTTAATVPATVTVAAGATFANFTVTSKAVASDATSVISGTAGGVPKTATLTVLTPVPTSLALSPTSAIGGTTSTATVTLAGNAPTGGKVVMLASSNTSAATVPASVTVAAGTNSKTFTVTAVPVGTTATSTISATVGSTTKTANLSVPAPVPTTLVLNPTSVLGSNPSTATLTLTGKAPAGGLAVVLSSNNAAATVPATVTVPANATSTTFTVTTTGVSATMTATISATYGGVLKTANLTITSILTSVTLSPTSVRGGVVSTGTVTLSAAAPAGGRVVTLTSSDPSATVPASVTVSSGTTTKTFTVTTTPVATSTSAIITANSSGSIKSAALTITPPVPTTLTFGPISVLGSVSSTGTVTLTGNAPTGGSIVTLSSNNAAASVPSSITVPAGSTSTTFTATTVPVASSTSVTITSVSGGGTKTGTLTVTPPVPSTLTLNPTTLIGGASSTGTITLTGNAPTSGIPIVVSSNKTFATVSSPITVPAGSNTTTFAIATTAVASSQSATISAAYGGTTKPATLTVQPDIPGVPTGLVALPGNAKVTLTWTASTGTVSNYKIFRGTSSGNYSPTPTATIGGGTTSYTDTGLTNGTPYFYVVKASNVSGDSANSNEANATPIAPPTGAPATFTATGQDSQVTLAWSSVATATNYEIWRWVDGGNSSPLVTVGNVNSYLDTAVTNGSHYNYFIFAANAGGTSPSSSYADATPMAIPGAPTSLSATPGNSQITLSWTTPSGSVSTYKVYRSTTSGSYSTTPSATITAPATSYTEMGLTNGTPYFYVIKASNPVGDSVTSNEASATPIGIPASPYGAFLNNNVTLNWTSGAGATSYTIKRSTTSGTGYATVGTTGNSSTTYLDTIPSYGVTYYYVISATNAGFESSNSAQAAVTPMAPPSVPQNFQATAWNGAVNLTWNASTWNPLDNAYATHYYQVFRGDSSGVYQQIGPSFLQSIYYRDSDVVNGHTYYYVVSAQTYYSGTDRSKSANSSEANVTPQATLPSDLAAANLGATSGGTSIVLSWSAPINAHGSMVTGYNIKRAFQSGGPYSTIAPNMTGTSYTDLNTSLGTAYYYILTSYNAGGEILGANSNEAIGTTMAEAPKFSDVGAARVTVFLPQLPRSATSFTLQRAVANPTSTPQPPTSNLLAWLRADALLGKDNNSPVSFWGDASAVRSNAVQPDLTRRPVYYANGLNGRPTIHFDGQNDFLQFPELSTIRSAFFLIRHRTGNQDAAALLGDALSANFRGGDGTPLFQSDKASPSLIAGQGYVNGISTAPASVLKPTTFQVLSFVSTDNLQAQYIANDRNLDGRYWDGDIAEVLLYNTALSSTDRQSVEGYLQRKYSLGAVSPTGLTWTNIAVNLPGASSYTDTTVVPNTTYQYRCRAEVPGLSVDGLSAAVTTCDLPPAAPGAPTFGVVTNAGLTVIAPGPALPLRAYTLRLQRKITVADDSTYIDIDGGVQPLGTSLAGGLTSGVSYSFRYVAVGDGGCTPGPAASMTVDLGQGSGLIGEYFSNMSLTNLVFSRLDPQINFQWNNLPPGIGMPGSKYGVRWSGQIQPRFSETYTFDANVYTGVRLWINNQLVVDGWGQYGARSGTIALTAGQKYAFKMEYYDDNGGAVAQLFWSSPSQVRELVPSQRLFPTALSGTGSGLRGQYYNGYLTNQTFARLDSQVLFDWGLGSPGRGISSDYFSTYWSGKIQPLYSETYTFTLNADDASTLWINGQQIATTASGSGSGTISLIAGQKYDIQIEYWESTGYASVGLMWSSPSQPLTSVPKLQLYPATSDSTPPTSAAPSPYGFARFVSQAVPKTMLPGGTYPVSVTMNNAGTIAWPAGGTYPYRLGTVNPQNNATWGLTRVSLSQDIAPGDNYTFQFNVTAPATPGSYNLQFQMLSEGVGFFGEVTQNLAIKVANPAALTVTNTNSSSVTLHTPALIGGGTSFVLQRAPVTSSVVPYVPSSGLFRWYTADSISGITGGSPVAHWGDAGGQGQSATQTDGKRQPLWIPNAVNGQPVVRFDGFNDWLQFSELSSIRSAVFVVRHRTGSQAAGALLGHSVSNDFRGGDSTLLFQSTGSYATAMANPNLLNGQGYVNGVSTAPSSVLKPTSFQILSFTSTGNLQAQFLANDRNGEGRFWNGDVAEVLLYNTPLADADRQSLEEFLARKYNFPMGTPPLEADWTTIATGVSGLSDYVDAALPADTAYWYRYVMAVPISIRPSGLLRGDPIRGTTRLLPPAAPGAPAGGVPTAISITVTAPGPTLPARSYFLKLQRKLATDVDGAYIDVNDGIAPSGNTVATDLLPQTTYRFRYVAVGPGGTTPSSLTADYTTSDASLAPPDAPAAPSYIYDVGPNVFTVVTPALPARATSMRLEYCTNLNPIFALVPDPPSYPSAVPSATGLAGNVQVQISYNTSVIYTFRCVAIGPGGSTIGASSSIDPYEGIPEAPGTPTFSNITASTVTVTAPAYSGYNPLTLQMKLTAQDDLAYSTVASALAGGSSKVVGNLTKGWSYTFRYVATNANGSTPGLGASVTPTDSTVTWLPATGIQCEGIRWPYDGVTIGRGQWGKVSSFLATDWDQRDVTTGDGTTSSLFSDSCTYSWSATGGTFADGASQRQSVWWQAPNTPGTYVVNLMVNDQGGSNKGNGETGSRGDSARPGYNEAPIYFSVSVVVQ